MLQFMKKKNSKPWYDMDIVNAVSISGEKGWVVREITPFDDQKEKKKSTYSNVWNKDNKTKHERRVHMVIEKTNIKLEPKTRDKSASISE